MTLHYRNLAASLLLSGLSLAAVAQAPAPGPMGGQPPYMGAGRGPMMGQGDMRGPMHAQMEQRMAGRLAELKQQLALTPQQEGAWTTWTNAVKPQAQPPADRPNMVQFARMTTPERIDRIKQMRAQRQQHMDQRLDATKVFYAALNAQQQKTFDEQSLGLLRGGRGGGHGPGGRGGYGGGPGSHFGHWGR